MYCVLNTVPIFVLGTFKLLGNVVQVLTQFLNLHVLCLNKNFMACNLLPRDKLEEDKEFDVVGDLSELQAKPLVEQPTNQNGGTTSHQEGEGFNL